MKTIPLALLALGMLIGTASAQSGQCPPGQMMATPLGSTVGECKEIYNARDPHGTVKVQNGGGFKVESTTPPLHQATAPWLVSNPNQCWKGYLALPTSQPGVFECSRDRTREVLSAGHQPCPSDFSLVKHNGVTVCFRIVQN